MRHAPWCMLNMLTKWLLTALSWSGRPCPKTKSSVSGDLVPGHLVSSGLLRPG